MNRRTFLTQALRRVLPGASPARQGHGSTGMDAWDALTDQAQQNLAAWSQAKNPTGRAMALSAAAACREQQARTVAEAFGDAIDPATFPAIAQDARLSAVLLRLVALTEDPDLVKPVGAADGPRALDPEALEIQLVSVTWLDYGDDQEAALAEAVEPHLNPVASLRWDLQAGPRSRRYTAALNALADAVAALPQDGANAEHRRLHGPTGWARALVRHADEQADRP